MKYLKNKRVLMVLISMIILIVVYLIKDKQNIEKSKKVLDFNFDHAKKQKGP